MPDPIRFAGSQVDLSQRLFETHTVVASPTDGTETIIASLTISQDIICALGVLLVAQAALTVGTNGVSANLRIRKTNASGTILWATGATTVTAANLISRSGQGLDASPTLPGAVYVVTLAVGSASAGSTVSAVSLAAFAV